MKKLKVFCLIIIFILICNISFAGNIDKSQSSTNDAIAYVSSNEAQINSEFYLILNLSKLDYTQSNIKIINSSQAVIDTIPEGVSDVSSSDNVISFNVNKNDIALDKIAIVYTANQAGKIDFEITVTSLDDDLSKWKTELATLDEEINELNAKINELKSTTGEEDTENIVENQTTENTVENSVESIDEQIKKLEEGITEKKSKKAELEEKIKNYVPNVIQTSTSITVSENIDNKNQEDEKEGLLTDKKMLGQDGEMEGMLSSMKKMMGQVQELEGNLKTANATINSLTNTVTYQGSQNNYLESLSISGVEFKSAFKKTTQNYFATVDSNTESVTVNAIAEDTNAIVTIYGNTNLVSGKNKILVTVTADDGSTRTYKIYVTK